jgi:hypothetical protein
MWYLYAMGFYSDLKKNEILSFVVKWMELENIILSEVSQAQKTKGCMFSSHIWNIDATQMQDILWKTGYAKGRSHTRGRG